MNDPHDFSDRLEIFFGEASDAVCHVYARLLGTDADPELHLTGTLTGPSCLYSKTLKATFAFTDRGSGKSLLAEAIVPEPCFWTPDMPHLYQADVQLRRGIEVLARSTRIFAIRSLGADRRKLVYDGKRWVLRAVSYDSVPVTDLSQWRASDAAMLVHNPTEDLCEQASRIGVLLVAQLDSPPPSANSRNHSTRGLQPSDRMPSSITGQAESSVHSGWLNELRRLSRWPAVSMIVFASGAAVDPCNLAHNLLLAEQFGPDQPIMPAAWAQVAVCDVADPESAAVRIADCNLPIIARRSAAGAASVSQARVLCDRLQRDLAGRAEIAGYIV